ncbi:MAG: regulatory iron-sulfur-containing complex subunit RicT [Spirochaetota bacterium]|nr:regulatory iron-sulfur-containing complex subunit RicT [Spirochaetota bacterium]
MIKYIKVKLNYNGAIELYKYEEDFNFKPNDYYIIETRYGQDVGCILPNSISIAEKNENVDFKVLRPADDKDMDHLVECMKKAEDAFGTTKSKIVAHKLSMKLINVYFFLDGNKILFNFTSDGRVDFRELVKDLAATFKTRIELRQIGVRDEAMLLGGFGVCGRKLCCTKIHTHSEPISIKMAKDQNLTLNSIKISGVCGRLMCCLDFEFDQYQKDNPDLEKPECVSCPKKISDIYPPQFVEESLEEDQVIAD